MILNCIFITQQINCVRHFLRLGWLRERQIGEFVRLGFFRRFQLILPIFLLGEIVRWIFLQFSVSYGVVKLYRLLYLQLGGCWRIRLLQGSIWKDVGCWWKVLCVVCVGRRKSLTAICFSLTILLGGFGVFVFKWLRVSFVSHIDHSSNFAQFKLSMFFYSFNDVWSTIWVGVVGEIWNHRNSIIFNRRVADASEVCVMVQINVWSWISEKCRSASFSFSS